MDADDAKAELTTASYTITYGIDSTNRASFFKEVVAKIVSNKSAIIHVYTSDGEFQFPDINADQWTQQNGKDTYFLAASKCWQENDLKECASLMEFELGVLWIQLVSKIDRDSINSIKFYHAIDPICLGRRESHSYDCIGLVADGQKFIWDNPNGDDVIKLQPEIQRIGKKYEINLQFFDLRI